MTADPHRVAVEVENAIKALTARAKLAGIVNPEPWAREFVDTLRHHGWAPCWPVSAAPPKPPFGTPPTPTFLAARAQLPRRTPQTATTEESE